MSWRTCGVMSAADSHGPGLSLSNVSPSQTIRRSRTGRLIAHIGFGLVSIRRLSEHFEDVAGQTDCRAADEFDELLGEARDM